MRPGCSMTGPAPQSARTSAKRASSLQKLAGSASDQAYSSAYSRSCVPRRAFTQLVKRVRFASAMRVGEGRHSSDIESSAVRDSSARFRAGRSLQCYNDWQLGPEPPSGAVQVMIWYGSLMSQAFQWPQLAAL